MDHSMKHPVHLIWDIDSSSIPDQTNEESINQSISALIDFASALGPIDSMRAITTNQSVNKPINQSIKLSLHDFGIELEECLSAKSANNQSPSESNNQSNSAVFIATRIMKISLQTAQSVGQSMNQSVHLLSNSPALNQSTNQAVHQSIKPILLVVTDDRDLSQCLSIARRSSIFQSVVLVNQSTSPALKHAVDQLFSWEQLISQPEQTISQAISHGRMIAPSASPVPSLIRSVSATSSISNEEIRSVNQTDDSMNKNSMNQWDENQKVFSPTPVFARSISNNQSNNQVTNQTNTLFSKAGFTSPDLSGQSIPSNLSINPLIPATTQSNNQSNYQAGSQSPRTRTYVTILTRVLAYCEQAKIIPRESVVKKRLIDSMLSREIDFEDLLIVCSLNEHCVIEGQAPQRIIWPMKQSVDPSTSQTVKQIHRFECADFFTPCQRLSLNQSINLIHFLSINQPSVDRGRFGFAQWLARNGPDFIQCLPHGILVECVQLLLNQKVLLFRKGKVSVNPMCNEQTINQWINQTIAQSNESGEVDMDAISQSISQANGQSNGQSSGGQSISQSNNQQNRSNQKFRTWPHLSNNQSNNQSNNGLTFPPRPRKGSMPLERFDQAVTQGGQSNSQSNNQPMQMFHQRRMSDSMFDSSINQSVNQSNHPFNSSSIPPRVPSRQSDDQLNQLNSHFQTPSRSLSQTINSSNSQLLSASRLTPPSSPFEYGLSVDGLIDQPLNQSNNSDAMLPIGTRRGSLHSLNQLTDQANKSSPLSIISSFASTHLDPSTPESSSFFSMHQSSPSINQSSPYSQPCSADSDYGRYTVKPAIGQTSNHSFEQMIRRPRSASNPLQPLNLALHQSNNQMKSYYNNQAVNQSIDENIPIITYE